MGLGCISYFLGIGAIGSISVCLVIALQDSGLTFPPGLLKDSVREAMQLAKRAKPSDWIALGFLSSSNLVISAGLYCRQFWAWLWLLTQALIVGSFAIYRFAAADDPAYLSPLIGNILITAYLLLPGVRAVFITKQKKARA